jgi:hypothetical protein
MVSDGVEVHPPDAEPQAPGCRGTDTDGLLRSSLRLMIAAARYPSRGDGRPALSRSNLPSGSGNGRAEWDSGHLNDRRHLGHAGLPRPLKKKLLYWIFPASRAGAAGGRRHGVFQQRKHIPAGRPSIRRCFA